MIRPEQLAGALERLDPRDRELLLLSLRRRVPDESLSRLYACTPADVARRRAGAIERLADDLGVKRGEDFGAVLQGLLDVETWTVVSEAEKARGGAGAEFAQEARRPAPKPPEEEPRVYRMPTAPAEPESEPTPAGGIAGAAAAGGTPEASGAGVVEPLDRDAAAAPAPVDAPPAEDGTTADGPPVPADAPPVAAVPDAPPAPGEADASPALQPTSIAPVEAPADADEAAHASPPAAGGPPAETPPAGGSAAADRPEPVLEMLGGESSGGADAGERRRPSAVLLVGLGIAAFAALAGFVGARELGGGSGGTQGAGGDGVRHFVPQERGPLGAAPFPSEAPDTSCYPTAYVTRPTVLYEEPGGDKLIRIAARTEWSSPRVLGVASQREGWLAVTVPELPNGDVGWIRRAEARVDCVRWSLHADLSKRELYVRKDGHTVRKMSVAVGSTRHPTPEGRFAVTDKLEVSDPNSPYGCCVLALSGHQTKLPDDWPGGDRLAVHATTDVDSIGEPVSLGCMRTTSATARWLIQTIPLGAPIFIRA